MALLLPRTEALLRKRAEGLNPQDHLFAGLIKRLFEMDGFAGSRDEFPAMRLLRNQIPRAGSRNINDSNDELLEEFKKHSPFCIWGTGAGPDRTGF